MTYNEWAGIGILLLGMLIGASLVIHGERENQERLREDGWFSIKMIATSEDQVIVTLAHRISDGAYGLLADLLKGAKRRRILLRQPKSERA